MHGVGPHLTGSIRADEFIVDLLGFDRQFGCRFGVPVILAGKVERDVLFTELRHQEGGEGTQPTCGQRTRTLIIHSAELLFAKVNI